MEAILYVRKVKVASTIVLGHAAALKQATAKYPGHLIQITFSWAAYPSA